MCVVCVCVCVCACVCVCVCVCACVCVCVCVCVCCVPTSAIFSISSSQSAVIQSVGMVEFVCLGMYAYVPLDLSDNNVNEVMITHSTNILYIHAYLVMQLYICYTSIYVY